MILTFMKLGPGLTIFTVSHPIQDACQARWSSASSVIRDRDKLSCDESLWVIFLITASYAFGRLCLTLPPLFSEGFFPPADLDSFFDTPFQTIYVILSSITMSLTSKECWVVLKLSENEWKSCRFLMLWVLL